MAAPAVDVSLSMSALPRASGRDPLNTFAVMEDVNDKLKLLHYEEAILKKRTDLKPISRTYFALPGKPSEQFPYFAQLAVWALQQTGVDMEWSEWDDPTATTASICDQLRRLHFPFLVDYPAAKLRVGSGDGVVAVLDFLLDKALDAKGFRVLPPVYTDAGSAGGDSGAGGNGGGGEEDDEDEIGDDTIEDDVPLDNDDGADTGYGGSGNGSNALGGGNSEEKAFDPEEEDRKALEAKVNPAEWALELERVGPKLKFKNTPANKEWRTHLEQSQKHGQSVAEAFPAARAALEKIGSNLHKAAERISAKERSINKEFEHLGGEFRAKQSALDSVQESYAALQKEVADLSRDLADKSDAIESIKSSVSDRNNTMTDVSPLRKLTTSLSQLKKEVAHMELRIGVVAQTLLQAKLKSQRGTRRPNTQAS